MFSTRINCPNYRLWRLTMNKKFIRAIMADKVAPGGMKAIELEGNEIVICNSRGNYYSIQRRCGHMNAPLDLGTLDGIYLTCPMHCAQFDITNGEALSGPVPADISHEIMSPVLGKYMQNIGMLMNYVRMESIRTFETKLEDGWVLIAL
jgi:nitrite reductase/ring-hydroxylating ferredoxin subunit